jgi:PAS domain S-box-containing protein
MKTKIEQSPATNPNPVLSVAKNGTVLYSNEAGELLLREWGVTVGEKLPSYIGDIVQKVISRNSPEKLEVKAGKRTYLIALHPSPEQECVNIYGFDISDQKELEVKPLESEALEIANVELSEIIDIQAVKPLMEDLYKLVHIPIGINDIKGNVLVSVGWQDICAKFHRVHPETFKHCVKSDSKLSSGVLPGEFKLYRCKNNMYDIVTPIMVSSQHVGYVFGGQFFFDDEPLDYELFRSQAKRYGFNEEEYIDALKKVPRLSRKDVEAGMSFFMTFANLLSQLSYSNIRLAKSLSERDTLLEALRKSESKYRSIIEAAQEGIWVIDRDDRTVFVNQKISEMLGYNIDEILGQSPKKFMATEFRTVADDRLREHRQRVRQAIDYRFIRKDGSDLWCIVSTHQLFDDEGKYTGSLGMLTDITERKKAEEALKEANDSLEAKVKERTAELEKAFYLLKESEKSLSEAQEMAHIGNWNRNLVTNELYWSDEMYRIFGLNPQEFIVSYNVLLSHLHPDDRDSVDNAVQGALKGEPFDIYHRIISGDGEERVVHAKGKAIFDEKNTPIRITGTVQDITASKKVEEKLRESEEKFRNIVETANEGIAILDSEGKHTYVNKKMSDMLGYSEKELSGKFVKDLAKDANFFKKKFEERSRGVSESYEIKLIRKDGSTLWALVNAKSLFDINGKFIGSLSMITDITEHKKMIDKIRHQAEEMKKIMDVAPVAIFVGHDPHSNNITGNLMANALFGTEVGENISASTTSVRRFFSKGHELTADELPMQEASLKDIDVYNMEFDMLSPSGERRTLMGSSSPLHDAEGSVRGSVGAFMDITGRKNAEEKLLESEKKYRNIVETANEGIVLLDGEGKITYLNKKMADMFGYSSEEIIGRPAWDFVAPEDVAISKSQIEKRRLGVSESYEIKLSRKDGSSLWVLINAKSIFDDDGKYIGSLSMHTDITKRKEAEKALSNIEIARKKEIHHRIKNNLQVISSLLDLQADKFRNKKNIQDSEVLEAFRESQDRVISMALIHEELYKGEESDTINFSHYINELADNLFLSYGIKNDSISLGMDIEEDTFFGMDIAVPLGMIINELVSNSLKHAFLGRDKGEIRIKLHREENGEINSNGFKSPNFVLVISDNGVGIPEDIEIEKLDSLGLQLVTSLVDQLDGKLELKRNGGTDFTIMFTVTGNDIRHQRKPNCN